MDLKIEYVDINSIKPYEKNARQHAKLDVDAIVRSIEEFGFNDPIGVWNDTIIEGHGRLMAAKQIGMDKVPVSQPSCSTVKPNASGEVNKL